MEVKDALRTGPGSAKTLAGRSAPGRRRPGRRACNGDVRPREHRGRANRLVADARRGLCRGSQRRGGWAAQRRRTGRGCWPETAQASTGTSAAAAGIRYDGGPEEGTRGAVVEQPLPAGTRYDGGPDEGSRAVVTEQPDTAISGGATPFSGARP